MKYYSNEIGEVFAYPEDGSQDGLIPSDQKRMTASQIQKHLEPEDAVPKVVSRFQARAALYQSGKLAEVEVAIAESDAITQMAWQDAQEFRRNSPTILALGGQLGLDLDALFIAAAQIQA